MTSSPTENHLVRRGLASAFDYFLIGVFNTAVFKYQPWFQPDAKGYYRGAGCSLILPEVIPWCVYFGYAEARFGRTLGKALFDLVVYRLDGRPLIALDCFKRHILDPFELFWFGIPAVVAVRVSPNHQRIGDMLAGTRVGLIS